MADKGKFCYDYPRPALTVDIALFARNGDDIEVLLIERAHEPFKGQWAFPGGFVDVNESLETAAARELQEETGLTGVAFRQVGAFGDPGRDPRGHTVSVVYAAALAHRMEPRGADDAADARWHPVSRLPELAFDHARIMPLALAAVFGK